MRLYYYTAKQWGMKSLWEKRLKIAQYADLNDPFELLPYALHDSEIRRQWNMAVKVLSEGHGVLCFSESWKSTLMWAHYGDKNKGMCLGFEIDDGPHLTKIRYVDERIPGTVGINKPGVKITQDLLETSLVVKHSAWHYENERRLRVRLDDQRDGLYYCNFSKDLVLREVIIGARSSLSVVDVAEALGPQPVDDVEIWTARPAHKTFDICRDLSKPRETVPGIGAHRKHVLALAAALKQSSNDIN